MEFWNRLVLVFASFFLTTVSYVNVGLMWSFFLIGHMYLCGIWHNLQSRKDNKNTRVMIRLVQYMLKITSSIVNAIGRVHMIT